MRASKAASIRPARPADAEALARIYNHFVRETIVTFDEEPLAVDAVRQRVQEIQDAGLPWLVAVQEGELLGYAYASQWKSRCAYRHAVEVTVYLDPMQAGRGTGSLLYRELLEVLQQLGMHTAIGGIALPNAASVALHQKFGFHQVAHFKEVGFKFAARIDVGYWQRIF